MTELSLEARTVKLAAINAKPGQTISAALRAAAYAAMPPIERTPGLNNEDGYFNEVFENYKTYGEILACERILRIAAELGGWKTTDG